jgi:hypothetical protein
MIDHQRRSFGHELTMDGHAFRPVMFLRGGDLKPWPLAEGSDQDLQETG